MNKLFDRIKKEVFPEIEKALGHKALIVAREDGLLRFRIVAEERLDETKGAGRWREWIRGSLIAAGVPCVKVSPIVSPLRPDKFSIYAVTMLMDESISLSCADRCPRRSH